MSSMVNSANQICFTPPPPSLLPVYVRDMIGILGNSFVEELGM